MAPEQLFPIASLFDVAPFEQKRDVKTPFLLRGLNELTRHHCDANSAYSRMVNTIFGNSSDVEQLSSIPWLPVRTFKLQDLKSVPDDKIVRTLVSSGTSGQAVSRIYLDKETAASQSKALAKIAMNFLGNQRLPMVLLDDDSFLRDRSKFNARAAAILGFSTLGRDHFYLLNETLEPKWSAFEEFLTAHQDQPILLFGFTFIVWQQFLQKARKEGRDLRVPSGSILVHGGGWKRMTDQQVSNDKFKESLADTFGIEKIHNYYGMVEQVGSVFFECESGFLHTPAYADLLIRDRLTLEPLPTGSEGVIQVLSLLPRSYPGHSLLTEDLGTVHGEDDCSCGRMGKRFSVSGRLPNVEVRGCSDTRTTPA